MNTPQISIMLHITNTTSFSYIYFNKTESRILHRIFKLAAVFLPLREHTGLVKSLLSWSTNLGRYAPRHLVESVLLENTICRRVAIRRSCNMPCPQYPYGFQGIEATHFIKVIRQNYYSSKFISVYSSQLKFYFRRNINSISVIPSRRYSGT